MKNPLKDIVRRVAFENGFFAVGVTEAGPLSELEHLGKWLSNDFCASMSWMRRNPAARCDPSSLLPGAKSVICVAMKYGKISPCPPLKKGGWGDLPDYHKVVLKKLKLVGDEIKKQIPAARFKLCVDTSPILEKPIAVRARIGWQGKHSIVIHPDIGSYFVLGEIITDLEIEPEKPMPNRCGDCKKCIEACPTGAIVEPYIIDANRCISYLTIEHEGPIDSKLTKHIKPDQYGCDVCQEACPYNV